MELTTSILGDEKDEIVHSEIKQSETSIQKMRKMPTASLPNLDFPFFGKSYTKNTIPTMSDYKCSFKTKFLVETRVGSPVVQLLFVRKAGVLLVGLVDGVVLMWKLERILNSVGNPGRKMIKMVHDVHYK